MYRMKTVLEVVVEAETVVVGINYWYNDNASAAETLKISTTDRLAFHHIHLTLYETEKLQLTQGGMANSS